MATMHVLMDYHVGDTLQMDVTVTDADGAALDLTSCDVEWMLNDPDGLNVETLSIWGGVATGDISISGTNKVQITVPSSRTKTYAPGYYSDQLRVWVPDPGFEDILATEMFGAILYRPPLAPLRHDFTTAAIDPSAPELEAPTLEIPA